jgi:hypothetical protein
MGAIRIAASRGDRARVTTRCFDCVRMHSNASQRSSSVARLAHRCVIFQIQSDTLSA